MQDREFTDQTDLVWDKVYTSNEHSYLLQLSTFCWPDLVIHSLQGILNVQIFIFNTELFSTKIPLPFIGRLSCSIGVMEAKRVWMERGGKVQGLRKNTDKFTLTQGVVLRKTPAH